MVFWSREFKPAVLLLLTRMLRYCEFLDVYKKLPLLEKYLKDDHEGDWPRCPSLTLSSCEVIGQLGHVPNPGDKKRRKKKPFYQDSKEPAHSTAYQFLYRSYLPQVSCSSCQESGKPCLPGFPFCSFVFKWTYELLVFIIAFPSVFCCSRSPHLLYQHRALMLPASCCPLSLFNAHPFPCSHIHTTCAGKWILVFLNLGHLV